MTHKVSYYLFFSSLDSSTSFERALTKTIERQDNNQVKEHNNCALLSLK